MHLNSKPKWASNSTFPVNWTYLPSHSQGNQTSVGLLYRGRACSRRLTTRQKRTQRELFQKQSIKEQERHGNCKQTSVANNLRFSVDGNISHSSLWQRKLRPPKLFIIILYSFFIVRFLLEVSQQSLCSTLPLALRCGHMTTLANRILVENIHVNSGSSCAFFLVPCSSPLSQSHWLIGCRDSPNSRKQWNHT